MKNFSRINFKRIIPGFISLVIVSGMALATFATNLDLEAFVKLDDYISVYTELDFLVDDIDEELERLYKFTCSNVKTFGGTGAAYGSTNDAGAILFTYRNGTQTYNWYSDPIANFSEEGYLLFNAHAAINRYAGHGKTDKWTMKLPARLIKWNTGIEPAPTCMLRVDISQTWPSTTSQNTVESQSNIEITMGPFTKFPRFTTAGAGKAQALICAFDRIISIGGSTSSAGQLKFAYNQEAEPTSWSTDGAGAFNLGTRVVKGDTVNSLSEKVKATDLENDPYSKTSGRMEQTLSFSTVPTVDFSQYTNFWIKLQYPYGSGGRSYARESSFDNFTLTTWNHDN